MGIFETQKFDVNKYIGKEFVYGSQDCYTLFINYYQDELGISIPKIENTEGWWETENSLYVDNLADAGFEVVDIKDIKENDLLLICLMSKVPSHAAIYLGDGFILHHAVDRLSTIQPLTGFWLKNLHTIARYTGKCQKN